TFASDALCAVLDRVDEDERASTAQQTLLTTIRILARDNFHRESRRRAGTEAAFYDQGTRSAIGSYLERVRSGTSSSNYATFRDAVRSCLESAGTLVDGQLHFRVIAVSAASPDASTWVCSTCATTHLHPSAGACSRGHCQGELLEHQSGRRDDDYFA